MKINNYSLFNSIILRSPLLSFETIHTINYNYLKEVSSDKVFLETIFLASPLLYDELQKLMVNKISKPKEEKRLQYSILRYLIRMCTRCTPFGLFAGCTVGKIKEENNIEMRKRFTPDAGSGMNRFRAGRRSATGGASYA